MKTELIKLHAEAMELIGVLAKKGEASMISRIAPIATQIEQLQNQLLQVEQETARLKEELATFAKAERKSNFPIVAQIRASNANGHGGKKQLRVQIDWARLGKEGGKEIITEHKSSDTMAKWAGRLYQKFGVHFLQRLSTFRINRGPMISKQPKSDFVNKQDGTLYSHHAVLDSGYYILTHSQTSQKVEDIRRACQFLGFPIGAVSVDEVQTVDFISSLMDFTR